MYYQCIEERRYAMTEGILNIGGINYWEEPVQYWRCTHCGLTCGSDPYEDSDGRHYCDENCALEAYGVECRCCGELTFIGPFCIDCETFCAWCDGPLPIDFGTLPGTTFDGQLEPVCKACFTEQMEPERIES